MSTIGVILARDGSKGLPNKNGLMLANKAVISWTLEHALNTPELDQVVLSTDSDVLARIARSYNIDVVLRPEHLCSDEATVAEAARFTVEADEAQMTHHEHVVVLYGNVPVRPADLTTRALNKLIASGCDSVQSLSPVGKRHPYWMKSMGGPHGDRLDPFIENSIDRRQDLPDVWALDGGIIALTRQSLFTYDRSHAHTFLGTDRRAVTNEEGAVIDIDTQLDLDLAGLVLQRRAQTQPAPAPTAQTTAA